MPLPLKYADLSADNGGEACQRNASGGAIQVHAAVVSQQREVAGSVLLHGGRVFLSGLPDGQWLDGAA